MATYSSNIRPETVAAAAAWFAEFRAREATASTRIRFDEWLRQSPEHIQAYLEVAAGWSELPTADPDHRIDIQGLVARARNSEEEKIIPLGQVGRSGERSVRRKGWAPALAASLVVLAILIGTGTWTWLYRSGTYTTGIGEQRTLTLADGSTVIMNALTSVRVRFSKTAREVDLLRGQAFFHDTDDPKRPFIVRSDGASVRALGTQFDIYRRSEGTVVTVVEGRVAVADTPPQPSSSNLSSDVPKGAGGPREGFLVPVLVSAGQQVVITTRDVEKPTRADINVATAWVERRLMFDNTPLAEVAAQFNRYSSRRLVITDPTLRSVGVSGVYSSADPESLIGFLQAQPGLHVVETTEEITVSRREQK